MAPRGAVAWAAPVDAPPPSDLDRLREVLGGEDLARLRARVRERVERGKSLAIVTSLPEPSPTERAAIDRLVGRPPSRGRSVRVDLDALAARLREAGLAADLRQAVEALDGPIDDVAARRIREAAAWEEALGAVGGVDPAFLAEPTTRASLRRAAGGDPAAAVALLESVAAVLAALPHAGTTRPVLAAELTGDAHALDPPRPLARLVAAALRFADGADAGADDALAAHGVFHQDLTRTVLALNLPAAGDSWLARSLRLHAEAAEPAHVTLRQLLPATPAMFEGIREVFACENPAVVGVAAGRLGRRSAPLVCVGGQPGSAVHRLFALLTGAGVTLRYHGDFDAAGLGILRQLARRHGVRPWRMGAGDYAAAVDAGRGVPAEGAAEAVTAWDPALGPLVRERGHAVHEEAVVEDLLADLARRPEPAAHQLG